MGASMTHGQLVLHVGSLGTGPVHLLVGASGRGPGGAHAGWDRELLQLLQKTHWRFLKRLSMERICNQTAHLEVRPGRHENRRPHQTRTPRFTAA